ncbi:cystatin-1-like [Centruroides sculpturatus]|uniref:cystatin-1-like n=1 Tax=Centruroides sculpturatus TaxID=218467 RepID=UPI000C6CD3AB|nr:cystatin-1-like [Centruroides sculpturatus]
MKAWFVFALLVCYAAAVGQWEDLDVNDEEAQDLAKIAAITVNRQFKSRNHHKLVEIVRVRKQVVAGFKYEAKITLRETDCKKSETTFEDANDCDFKDGSFVKYCTVTLWDQVNKEDKKLIHFSCSSRPFQ